MSYDMNLGQSSFNYTYNGCEMWYTAVREIYGSDEGIRYFYGMTGKEAALVQADILAWILDHKDLCETFQADNGWGTVQDGLLFMTYLIKSSLNQPDEIWEGD